MLQAMPHVEPIAFERSMRKNEWTRRDAAQTPVRHATKEMPCKQVRQGLSISLTLHSTHPAAALPNTSVRPDSQNKTC